jgi:phage gp36-like protein
MPALATVQELLGRLSASYVEQLVTAVDGGVDEDRVRRALEDASAELGGWLPRIPAALRPSAATLRVHCIKVAVYLLSLDRPGAEFEQIRNAYEDTISFYRSLEERAGAAASAESGTGAAARPEPAFSERTLKGLV